MMWTREELKGKAKAVLSRSYWKALLVSFVAAVLSGKGGNVSYRVFNQATGRSDFDNMAKGLDPKVIMAILGVTGIIVLLAIAFGIALQLFLAYPLRVGAARFFISLTAKDTEINKLGYAFKTGRYGNVIKVMFITNLIVFLWTLLFIIPGIVKGYAYSMVPYILADNPQIDYKRAMELSEQMTMGEKANIWVLDLSFIGWYLLGLLACGIGMVFVHPYVDATKAELYITLRKRALREGLFTYEELNEKM